MIKPPVTTEPHHHEASRLELSVTALIQELKKCDSQDDILGLNRKIRELLGKLQAKISALQCQAIECKSVDEKDTLNRSSEWHSSQYKELEKKLRQANLSAKTTVDSQSRRSLMSSSGSSKRSDNSAQTASSVTSHLMELRQRLSAQVESSGQTLEALATSSGMVSQTSTEMTDMKEHLVFTHRLLRKFNRREVTDFLLILCGVAFFFAVVLYILKKRTYG